MNFKRFVVLSFMLKLSMFLESFLKSNTNKLPPIAQLVEQLPFKQTVVGSSPTGRTSKNRESGFFVRPVGLEPKAPVNKERGDYVYSAFRATLLREASPRENNLVFLSLNFVKTQHCFLMSKTN